MRTNLKTASGFWMSPLWRLRAVAATAAFLFLACTPAGGKQSFQRTNHVAGCVFSCYLVDSEIGVGGWAVFEFCFVQVTDLKAT